VEKRGEEQELKSVKKKKLKKRQKFHLDFFLLQQIEWRFRKYEGCKKVKNGKGHVNPDAFVVVKKRSDAIREQKPRSTH
jgi:hypothetical protein